MNRDRSLRLRLSVGPWSLPLAALLCACSASSAAVTAPLADRTPSAAAPRATATPSVLVWTAADGEAPDAHKAHETWVLDAQGRVLEHGPGVRIAMRGRVWQWDEVTEPVATQACPRYDDDGHELPGSGPPPPAGTGVRATLQQVGGGERYEVVSPASDEDAQELEQTVALVASVGPYLFVRESTYAYACGAHGNVGVSYRVWDAERRADVWSSVGAGSDGAGNEDEAAPALPVEGAPAEDARTRALAVLGADEDVSSFGSEGQIDAALTEIVPSFAAADGSLSVSLQFTAPSCYACSDGAWSSYTKSTLQPLATLPGWLRPWASPPESVRAFLRAHLGVALGGWSTLRARPASGDE